MFDVFDAKDTTDFSLNRSDREPDIASNRKSRHDSRGAVTLAANHFSTKEANVSQDKLPSGADRLAKRHPQVWKAFAGLGEAVATDGPLDTRTRRLVKLALAIGADSEGAVHSHVRRAIDEGITAEEVRHVALLAIPTLGLPRAVKGMTWMDDILVEK